MMRTMPTNSPMIDVLNPSRTGLLLIASSRTGSMTQPSRRRWRGFLGLRQSAGRQRCRCDQGGSSKQDIATVDGAAVGIVGDAFAMGVVLFFPGHFHSPVLPRHEKT